jgi:hypothetical protein
VPDEEPPFPSHRRRPDRILNEGMPTSGLCRVTGARWPGERVSVAAVVADAA